MTRLALYATAAVATWLTVSVAAVAIISRTFRLLDCELDNLGRQPTPPPDTAYIDSMLLRFEAEWDYVARQMKETNR